MLVENKGLGEDADPFAGIIQIKFAGISQIHYRGF